jgi:hypothetical protein
VGFFNMPIGGGFDPILFFASFAKLLMSVRLLYKFWLQFFFFLCLL